MQGSTQFKQALLKGLLLGLRKRGVASREMSFLDRKRAIRSAADAALASARERGGTGPATRWSRAMQAATEFAEQRRQKPSSASSKRVVKRCHRPRMRKAGTTMSTSRSRGSASVLARAMVMKRTRALKEIVPGGGAVDDERTLLGEALDYAVCLKAQVDVMQLLVRALQPPKQ